MPTASAQVLVTASADGLRARLDGAGAAAADWTAGSAEAARRLRAWAERYERAARSDDADSELLEIGREMALWLDDSDWLGNWLRRPGARRLIVQSPAAEHELGRLLHDAPWELLTGPGAASGHLAGDPLRPLAVARRLGAPENPQQPLYGDLCLLFMAAAPQGETVLDFEAEESGILDATRSLHQLLLTVEESGSLAGLQQRLGASEGVAPDIVHLSCHGGVDDGLPVVYLEDQRGERHPVPSAELAAVLAASAGAELRLVVLSACGTAAQTSDGEGRRSTLVTDLICSGVDQVLGWDGSVADRDATQFAAEFYKALTARQDVVAAAARARQRLLTEHAREPAFGRHWHMARVYLGPRGGQALLAQGGQRRALRSAVGEEHFLDKARAAVPVATRSHFVGRRRAIQQVLGAFQDGRAVLVHGMGNLGKSSLAARIAHDRLPQLACVVVFGRYDALEVWDRLLDACTPAERPQFRDRWRSRIAADERHLADALDDLLAGPLAARPVLLIIDDLERLLEEPRPDQPSVPVQPERRPMLAAVLRAFGRQQRSKLLLTSRYTFSLPDSRASDLAADLVLVPLRAMDESDRRKQQRALLRDLPARQVARLDLALLQRAGELADGNPGLQALLSQPVLAGEAQAAGQAFAVIEHYLQRGVPPAAIQNELAAGRAADERNAVLAFFRRMAFDTYRNALSSQQLRALQAGCLFTSGLPLPLPALQAAARAAGVGDAAAAVQRLLGLGLLDDHGQLTDIAHAAVNPLARPLVDAIPDDDARQWAAAALPALADAWIDGGTFRWPVAFAAEAWRLIQRAGSAAPARLVDAATAVLARHRHEQGDRAQAILNELVLPARQALDAQGHAPSRDFWSAVHDVADRAGDTGLRMASVAGLKNRATSPFERGSALLREAWAAQSSGDPDGADGCFAEAAELFRSAGADRDVAIARAGQADILQARGQLDEALRIRLEEELPVYEKLGDVRSKAVTQGQIADILQARGQLDEALRIRLEEQLPVYEKLGDVREKAVTHFKIASLRLARNEQQTEEGFLAIFESLRQAYDIAVLMRIPDGISAVGPLYAQILARRQAFTPALEVLARVDEACAVLGEEAGRQRAAALRQQIEAMPGGQA